MGKRQPLPKTETCPECGAGPFSLIGLRGHRHLKHGVAPVPATNHPASADGATAPGASSASESPPVPGANDAPAPDAGPSSAAEPAIDPEGAELLTEEPHGEPEPEPEPVRAELHGRNATDRDYARVADAAVRRTNKLLAKATGLPEQPANEVQDVADMVKPAAEIYGPRLGGLFWLAMCLIALGSLALSYLAAARLRARALPPAS